VGELGFCRGCWEDFYTESGRRTMGRPSIS
jgi:hypothetical protein